ncbi:Up-regulated during septation-domain-containing protein [Cladochytrium replicatum]|nr:Up-regulated during septation-domain-containing protein [Cladochytrium replicatum]
MSRQNYLRGSPPTGRNQDAAKKPSMNDLLNDLEDFTSDFRGGKYNNDQNNLRPQNAGGGISPSSPSVTGIAPPRGTSLNTRRGGGGGEERQAVTLDRARLGRQPSNPNMRQNEFDNPVPLTTMTIDRGGGGPFRRDYDGPPLGSPNIGQNTISRARSRSRGRLDDEPPPPLPNSNTTPLRQQTRPDQQNATPVQPPNFSPYSRNRPNGESPSSGGGGSPIPFPRPRQGSNAGLEDRGKMFETDDSGSDSGGGRSRNGTANKDELANALQRGRMRAEAAMAERSESGGTATLRRPSFGRAGTLERGGGGRRDPPPPQGSPPAANDNPSSPSLNSADGGGGERSGRNLLKAAAASSNSNSSKDSSLTSPTLTNTSGTINLSEQVHAIFGGSSNSVAAAVAFGNAFNLSRKDTNNTASPSSATAIADDMLMQLAVQEALLDTKRFPILPETRYESYKKDLSELNKSMASLHTRLTTENRIREAALSLAKMNAGGGKEQARNAQEQLANASKKVDAVATELWKTAGRVMEIERHVLKHLAAVLRYESLRLTEDGGEIGVGGGGEMKTKLSSAETKIKEQETMIAALKGTVTRLESENEEVNKELPDLRSDKEILERKLKRLERMVKESDEEIKRLRTSKESSDNENERKPDPRSQEVARLKLEVERWKAENEKSQLENQVAQDQIAELRLQLEEDQLMVESKDRNISNLMSEIEMLQTKVDMYAAKDSRISAAERERNMGSIRSQITSQLNEQNTKRKSVFGGQLKDAVMEREKLKSELREEKSKVRDLQLKVLELEAAGMGGEELDVKQMLNPRRRGLPVPFGRLQTSRATTSGRPRLKSTALKRSRLKSTMSWWSEISSCDGSRRSRRLWTSICGKPMTEANASERTLGRGKTTFPDK